MQSAFTAERHASFYKLEKCLAQEEQEIHKKKDFSARYKLNQNLLNLLIKISNAHITDENLLRVCHAESPAHSFLYLLFTDKDVLRAPQTSVAETAMVQAQLKQFKAEGYELFLSYINQVQASMPTASCLTKYIPPLKRLLEQNKFLAPLVGQETIFTPKELQETLKKLSHLKAIQKKCHEDEINERKARLKAS